MIEGEPFPMTIITAAQIGSDDCISDIFEMFCPTIQGGSRGTFSEQM
jgi:hypothetical protein